MISRLGSGRPEYGTGAELEVLTTVVLGGVVVGGGRGNYLGVFIALVIIQSISNGMVLVDVPVFLRMVVKGALLVLVIAIDAVLITDRAIELISSWHHSGFNVYCTDRIYPR